MTAKQLQEIQASAWATRRRDGVTLNEIAADSNVTSRTVYNRLKEFGYDTDGKKEGGDGDQTIIPPSSTEADDLNNGESTAMTTGEPK